MYPKYYNAEKSFEIDGEGSLPKMVYIKPLLQLVSQSLLPKSNLRNMILRFVSSFSPILCLKRSRVHVHVKLILVYPPWILVEFLGILLFVILKGVVPKMILPTVTQQLKPELPLDSPAVNQQYPVSKNRNHKPSAWNHEVGIELCEWVFFFICNLNEIARLASLRFCLILFSFINEFCVHERVNKCIF